MYVRREMLLAGALPLFVVAASIAQERYHTPDPNLMARLSYDSSGVVRQGDVRHLCIAISRDGQYRIARSTGHGQTQRLQGKMPKEELQQLSDLLAAPEFRKLSGDHGGLIHQEAETFAAEIPPGERSNADGTRRWIESEIWRLQWMNGDNENPFPISVSKVVSWLQQFRPRDGIPFDYVEYPDVCPSGGLRLLQPAVAENSRH
ncbi:MAG TPA: hypothetical protein VMH04_04650 [Candidatus Solibacter sp.]|nr:hypothetical protein [Candidatus Solibacter sp.]